MCVYANHGSAKAAPAASAYGIAGAILPGEDLNTQPLIQTRILKPEATHMTHNWAGNITYHATETLTPTTPATLQNILTTPHPFKALGTRHSFNTLADTTGTHISLAHLDDISIAPNGRSVTIGSGLTYGQLAPVLHQHGLALHNLASLPHISVAGAISTATHGSGTANGNLSTAVSALNLVTPTGELLHISRATHPDTFPGFVVSLGALGVFTRLTLETQPAFTLSQSVYENLPFAELEHHLDAIFDSAYSVSLFTDWQLPRATQAWVKHRVHPGQTHTPAADFFGATLQTQALHPLPGHSAENCTTQLGTPGPWHERLPHFRLDFTPSSGAELQTEYFVPITHAFPAIRAVESLRDLIAPHLFISELRTVQADDLWLSPAYRQTSLAIHFTWKPHQAEVLGLLHRIEAALRPFHARPHWAKLSTTPAADLARLYPRLPDFLALRERFDPAGRLHNEYLQTRFPR